MSLITPDVMARVGVGLTQRISKLRDNVLLTEKEICIERAVLLTESYQTTEGEAQVIRCAKALKKVLEGIPIYIFEGELIVGNHASKPRSAPVFPEYSWRGLLDEMDSFANRPGDKFIISEKKKQKLRDVLGYWKGKTVEDTVSSMVPCEVTQSVDALAVYVHKALEGIAEVCPDYPRILQTGFNKIKEELGSRLASLDIASPDYCEKAGFYQAGVIVSDAIISYAKRYAVLASDMAEKEKDFDRKKELERIAEICDKVPAQPAESFWEALQFLYFVQVVIQNETNGLGVTPGRFDQYIYPYLKKDLAEGKLGLENAQELLECFWLKMNEPIKLWNNVCAKLFAGFPMTQNCIIGGILPNGEEGTNLLSYMCLDAEADVRLPQPGFSLRVHSNTPEDLLLKACRVLRLGAGGKPKFFNDNIGVQHLLSLGASIKEARDYVPVGCVETEVPGKTFGNHFAGLINIAKCLELSLNNGLDPRTGKQIGPRTGDPTAFSSFEELLEAFKQQVSYCVKLLVCLINIAELAHQKLAPMPFLSLLVSGCVENGKDITMGGAIYNFSGPEIAGIPTVADSLAALKRLVFEDKRLTKEELLETLKDDFQGKKGEKVRQMLLNDAPKYGNDDDYVDLIAKEVEVFCCLEISKHTNPRGGRYSPAVYTVSANVPLGEVVGATPDGRKAWQPLGENISPCQGRDKKGPTATMKSVAKLDHVLAPNGTLLNMKFNPKALATESDIKRFADLIRAYFDLGGYHVQFNIVDAATLKNAQRNPEKYKDLLVRVAAYSAFFIELSKELQDDIISRTEFETI